MIVDFNKKEEITVTQMNGGMGQVKAKMHMSDAGKIITAHICPGGSIGMHTHNTSDDINYVLSGLGMASCDGKTEFLKPGVCHVCKKGSSHSIINTGDEDLVLLTIVIEK